ncbi:MAG: hypothetical protein ACE5KT_03390 [Methanosarcinales archaeon]
MEIKTKDILRRIGYLQREIEYLKRDLMYLGAKATMNIEEKPKNKPSLFGSVRGGDITDEMIKEAKKDLFRELEDV